MLQEHNIPLRIIKTRYMESNKQNELREEAEGLSRKRKKNKLIDKDSSMVIAKGVEEGLEGITGDEWRLD